MTVDFVIGTHRRKDGTVPRRTTRRRIGVPDAFRRLPMHEEDLAGLPSFRVIRVPTEALGTATRHSTGATELHALAALEAPVGYSGSGLMAAGRRAGWSHSRTAPVYLQDDAGARRDPRGDGRRGSRRGGANAGQGTPR